MDRLRLLQTLASAQELRFACEILRGYRNRAKPCSPKLFEDLLAVKDHAKSKEDEYIAGATWCLETIARAQDAFVTAHLDAKDDRYYDAWQNLEKGEVQLGRLAYHFDDEGDEYG